MSQEPGVCSEGREAGGKRKSSLGIARDSHGVRLLMLVPIRPLGGWAGNLIIYMVLRVHSPHPTRARPVNPEQMRLGFTARSLSRGPQHPPAAHAHTLPQARPVRPRVDLPSPSFPATPASPPPPGEGRSRGGSGANPHRAGLVLLADQARARSPQCARAAGRARGPGRRRVRPARGGGARRRARVAAGGAHRQPW